MMPPATRDMGFAASADYNERTENDKVTGVVGVDTYSIGATRKLSVGTVHQVSVSGAQSYTVGGSRQVNVDANKSIGAASEAVTVGGARMFTIGGDLTTSCSALTRLVGAAKAEAPIEHQSRSVTGASTIAVGAAWKVAAGAHASVSVLGASVEQVGAAKNIVCGKYNLSVTGALSETLASRSVRAQGDRGEQFGATATYAIGGSAKVSGSDVVFKARASSRSRPAARRSRSRRARSRLTASSAAPWRAKTTGASPTVEGARRTMTNPKASPRKTAPAGRVVALGPGIHPATVELKSSASYHVKLLDGRRARATLARGVSPRLLDECLQSRRVVMLADADAGPVILGALQTAPVPQVQEGAGVFEVQASQIRLKADTSIVLQAGSSSLVLEKSGVARIDGERMVIDVAALLRVLATKVELP